MACAGVGGWPVARRPDTLRPSACLTAAITVNSLEQAARRWACARSGGCGPGGYRIDSFTDDPGAVTELVQRSALPCIITCRPTWEGGAYDGDEQTRISVLEHAGLGPDAYIDVELKAWQTSANLRQKVSLVVDRPARANRYGVDSCRRTILRPGPAT
ncbi:MAG: type I 3-dehydroquinate dehydratase [Phycisphaerales bacterium]